MDDVVIPATADGLFIIGFHRDSDQPVTIKIISLTGKPAYGADTETARL